MHSQHLQSGIFIESYDGFLHLKQNG